MNGREKVAALLLCTVEAKNTGSTLAAEKANELAHAIANELDAPIRWQPIETLLTQDWSGYVLTGRYDEAAGCWSSQIADWTGDQLFHAGRLPTHWAPLTPPKGVSEKGAANEP